MFCKMNFKHIQLEVLIEEFSLDKNDTCLLLTKFSDNYKNFSKEIKQYEINSEEFEIKIHNLKGVSGNLKFNKLYYICEFIKEAEDNQKDMILEKLVFLLDEIRNEIENCIKPLIKKVKLEKSDLKEHIEKLILDLNNFNFIKEERFNTLYNSLEDFIDMEFQNLLKETLHKRELSQSIILLKEILNKL